MEQTLLQFAKDISFPSAIVIVFYILYKSGLLSGLSEKISKNTNTKLNHKLDKIEEILQRINENDLIHILDEIDWIKGEIKDIREKLYVFEGRLSKLEAKVNGR